MKKALWLICFVVLIILVMAITDAYGLFETNAEANKDLDIGVWSIVLNGSDVSFTRSITLDDFTYSASNHTESGFFAPGISAEFDLEIDTSNCDVSVEYTLDIDDTAIADHPNIQFSIVDTDTNQTLVTNTYSGISYLSDSSREKTLKIYLSWIDNPQYDELDSELIGERLSFVINANFKQYVGNNS